MLDIRYIEAHKEEVIDKLHARHYPHAATEIAALLQANVSRKAIQKQSDDMARTLKQKAGEIGKLLAQKNESAASALKKEIKGHKEKYNDLIHTLKDLEKTLKEQLLTIPNLPDSLTPPGKTEADNKVVHQWGDLPTLLPDAQPHWELLDTYGLASFSLGAKITGSGFPIYKGKGAQLQRALIRFFIEEALQKGYEEVIPPLLVNAKTAQGTGQLPDKEGQMYTLQAPELYLIPTAEVPVTNIYSERIIPVSQLPIQHVAYSSCFRKEAGSWGAHVRGLNRLHQFDKVELVEVVHPSQGRTTLEKMRTYVQSLLEKLGLPYRTLLLCCGELGQTAAITYDLEVWSAAQEKWLEVSSISLFNDYQARRMNLRYDDGKEKGFCYTLNGSALALPRIVAALLENYQTTQEILLPDALKAYLPFSSMKKP